LRFKGVPHNSRSEFDIEIRIDESTSAAGCDRHEAAIISTLRQPVAVEDTYAVLHARLPWQPAGVLRNQLESGTVKSVDIYTGTLTENGGIDWSSGEALLILGGPMVVVPTAWIAWRMIRKTYG